MSNSVHLTLLLLLNSQSTILILLHQNHHLSPIVNGYNVLKSSSSPAFPSTSTSTPITSRRNISINHSPRLISPSSSFSSRVPKMFGKQQPCSATPTRTLRRQVMLGVRDIESPRPTPGALRLEFVGFSLYCFSSSNRKWFCYRMGSTNVSREGSFDSRTRPAFNRSSTSPERTTTITETTQPQKLIFLLLLISHFKNTDHHSIQILPLDPLSTVSSSAESEPTQLCCSSIQRSRWSTNTFT